MPESNSSSISALVGFKSSNNFFNSFYQEPRFVNFLAGNTPVSWSPISSETGNRKKSSIKLSGGHLLIHHPDTSVPSNIEGVLYSWYKSRAEQKFRERFELLLSSFPKKYPIKPPELHIRKMKFRWGSYSPSGRLTLNLELIKAPIDCIAHPLHDYSSIYLGSCLKT